MTPERLAEIRAHNDKCTDLIGKLASGHERWRMQIPANESQDSDLILIKLTAMVTELIDALTTEREHNVSMEVQLRCAEENTKIERERTEKFRAIAVNLLHILKQSEQMHHQDESWPEWQRRIEELKA